jgi:hypothetical protein
MKNTALAPLHPLGVCWQVMVKVTRGFYRSIYGQMFFIIMDAYSKWLKIVVMKNITTCTTIEKLQGIFTTHGLPEIVVSDNGPTFTSKEFEEFIARN